MSGNVSKQPAVGTPLSVICKTPAGNVLIGVTIEVIGLRREVTKTKQPPGISGQNDHVISAKEIDDTRDGELKDNPDLPEGECILNITALAPASTKLGPNVAPFVAGGAAVRQIRLKKGSQEFKSETPLVMTLIHECLFNFTIDPAILRKRVRNLTPEEAYKELIHRHKQGTIQLIPEPDFKDACVPILPDGTLPRKKITGKDEKGDNVVEDLTDAQGNKKVAVVKLVGMAPKIDGVRILYTAFIKRDSKGASVAIANLNPINGAGLVRLVMMLRRRFRITEFHHVGLGRQVIIGTADCHDWGRAIDYVGVRLPDPVATKTDPLFLTLQLDWATETVPKISEIGKRPSKESRDSAWPKVPNNTVPLEFRFLSLNSDFNPTDSADEQKRVVFRALNDPRVSQSLKTAFNTLNDPKRKPKATDAEIEAARTPLLAERKAYVTLAQTFFQFFFNWAADNYNHRSADADPSPQSDAPEFPDQPPPPPPPPNTPPPPPPVPAAEPMGTGGRVMHPDHLDTNTASDPPPPHFDANAKNGREAHNSHYHIQIGPTGGAMPNEAAALT